MLPQTTTKPTPRALKICGGIGIAGALFAILADVLSWFLAEGYSPIRQTISNLAIGHASWLIDLGLWSFALACAAVGVGMLVLRLPAKFWRIAVLATIGTGIPAAIIAVSAGYAGPMNAGANPHQWSLYALYIVFAVAALAAAPGLWALDDTAEHYSRFAGWAWVMLAPAYYFWFPSGWAGAFERVLALLMVVWLVIVGRVLLHEGRRLAGDC